MTAALTTRSNLNTALATIITNEGILALRGAMGWVKKCRFYTELGKKKGQTISVPIFPTFTPETKTDETTDYALQDGSTTEKTLTLTSEIDLRVGYSVLASMAAYPEHIRQILDNVFTSIVEKFATDVAAAVVDGSTGYSLSAGSYGTVLNTVTYAKAIKQLFDYKYKINPQNICAVISSNDFWNGILQDESLSQSQKESAKNDGFIPNLFGAEINPSQYVKLHTDGNPKNFIGYMPEILIANSVPFTGPRGSDWVNIMDEETGLTIQMYEFGDGKSGTDQTVVRTSYTIGLARRTSGVIVAGAIGE